jgi:hypothetical protein
MTKLNVFSISLSLFTLAACADPFDPGSTIVSTRVLGARVEVDGEPQRSTPRAGETAHVRFVLAGVEAEPSVRWTLVACLPSDADAGPCTAPLVVSEGSGSQPDLTVTVPAAATLGDVRSLQVAGIFCTRGAPGLAQARCVGEGAEGVSLIYDLALAREDDGRDANLQPSLTDTAFRFDDAPWRASVAEPTGECEVGLPEARADEQEHAITLELGPDARQVYLRDDLRTEREELQVSHFVTAGELARQFSFIEPSDQRERPSLTVKWTAPQADELGQDRQRVRLIAVVRDQRGGLSLVERALCVVR